MMLLSDNRQRILLALGIIFLTIFCIFGYYKKENQTFKITQYSILTEKPIENLRILLVTDLHLKEYGENNEILIEQMKNLEPDMIAVVGDLVIHNNRNFDNAISFLDQAAEIAPTYFSAGNHEWTLLHHYKHYDFLRALNNCKATYLDDQMMEIMIDNNNFVICGVYDEPDARFGFTDEVFEEFTDKKYEDKFKLLLSHCPLTIANTVTNPNADLVLSGHEHGGQMIIPFTNQGLYSKNQGFFPKYTNGINTIADNTVIISTGLSNSYHSIPRINNQPELVVIDVN